jgi:microcystin-dependent protein
VQITLPLPGFLIVENLTTGSFVLSFRAVGVGQVVAVDQGVDQHIYNDGTNVRLVNMGVRGRMEHWAGVTAVPAWVAACTSKPYLLCDGTIYNFSDFPYLGPRLGATFGGNGITTFGVPDMGGRVPLAYDYTASRITVAGCGINGQVVGSSGGLQTATLTLAQIPIGITSNVTVGQGAAQALGGSAPVLGNSQVNAPGSPTTVTVMSIGTVGVFNLNTTGSSLSNNTGGGPHAIVPPAEVTGIWVIKT